MNFALRPAAPLVLLIGISASTLASESPVPGTPAPASPVPGASALTIEPHHSLVAHLVAGSLQSYHYASRPIDDEVAAVWLDAFLDSVDSGRVYLHAADVAELKARASEIDDDILAFRPRLALAMDIQERVAARAERAIALSEKALAEPFKFDDAKAAYAPRGEDPEPFADQAAADAWWRQRAQAEVLDVVLGGESIEQAREIVARRNVRRARDLRARSTNDVLETYLSALASVYDPHSAYFAPTTSDDFDIRMRDALEGIGAELRAEDQYTKVNRLIPGGPAEASGLLRRGDLILAVAQGAEAPVDVVDMRLDEVVKLIRGKKGTEVRLTVRPAAATDPSETRVVPIVRDRVRLEDASAKGLLHEVPDGKGATRKVGVVEVPSFYYDSWAAQNGEAQPRSTTVDVERAVYELRAQQAEVIVLDLRGNGGGVLNEAVNVAGLFIDRGPVVQVLDPKRGAEVLRDKSAGHVWAGPLVVLTDELSASASEIVAGALQDHGRAIVVGSKQTHGKGTVQSVIDLGDVLRDGAFREFSDNAGALKITVQKFYRISGESTQTRGVVADVILPSPWEGLDVLEGDLPRALPYDTIEPARYTPLPMTIDLDPIREASASRVASEPVFGWFAEDATEIAARSGGAPLSLHLATRQKERAQNAARVDARRAHLGLPKGDGSDDEEEDDISISEALDRVVLNEALRVAVDLADRWTTPPALLASERAIRITESGGEAGDKGAKKR